MNVSFKSRIDLGTSTDDVLSGVQISLPADPNIVHLCDVVSLFLLALFLLQILPCKDCNICPIIFF